MRPLIGSQSTRARGGEWVPVQDYTPAWTATAGTAPAIGNGSLTGRVEVRGKLRRVSIRLVGGSTTTWGSGGFWRFTVPTAATRDATGPVFIEDAGTTYYIGQAILDSGGSTLFVVQNNSAQPITFNSPMTWATNDRLLIDLEYLA